jgi:hypothetical protein
MLSGFFVFGASTSAAIGLSLRLARRTRLWQARSHYVHRSVKWESTNANSSSVSVIIFSKCSLSFSCMFLPM